MSGGTTFDTDFASLTVDNFIRSTVTDQVFDEHGLLGWIERKVGVDRVAGGDNILIPVGTAEDTAGGSYSGFDVFDTTPSETITNAVYTWKHYQQPIVVSAREVLRNAGRTEGVINMWLAKSDVALKSLRSKLNADAFLDGTGNSGKNILGLGILVDSAGTVGGINRSTATYWQSNETAAGGSLAVDTSTGMLRVFTNCSTGSGDGSVPDALMTTQAVYEAYENLLAPDIRHTSGVVGEAAFSGLAFKGAPLMWDADCNTQTLYFLRSDALEAYVHPDRDFMTTKIAKADDGTLQQDAWVANILAWFELVIAEPRRTGKLTGVTNS